MTQISRVFSFAWFLFVPGAPFFLRLCGQLRSSWGSHLRDKNRWKMDFRCIEVITGSQVVLSRLESFGFLCGVKMGPIDRRRFCFQLFVLCTCEVMKFLWRGWSILCIGNNEWAWITSIAARCCSFISRWSFPGKNNKVDDEWKQRVWVGRTRVAALAHDSQMGDRGSTHNEGDHTCVGTTAIAEAAPRTPSDGTGWEVLDFLSWK